MADYITLTFFGMFLLCLACVLWLHWRKQERPIQNPQGPISVPDDLQRNMYWEEGLAVFREAGWSDTDIGYHSAEINPAFDLGYTQGQPPREVAQATLDYIEAEYGSPA